MIRAAQVSFAVGAARLVDRLSLEVDAGELVAIVGPNGAGKSTLLGLLAGDLRPSAGAIELAGRSIAGLAPAELAALRAVLRQASSLAAGFTAAEVVMLGQRDGAAADRRRRANARLAEVELGHLAERRYPTLSGGERQRVQLARVLEQLGDRGGRVLLLDEPTAALDLRHQHLVLAAARRAADAGHAVVAVLHDLSLAARHADRLVLLAGGRCVAAGRPTAVLRPEVLGPVFGVELAIVAAPDGRGLLVAAVSPTCPPLSPSA